MSDLDPITSYFPELNAEQREQFLALGQLYTDWNERVNLISRKDIEHLYEHHILHSMGIAKVVRFERGTRVVDVGTGGGLPLIPLAILFQHCTFHGIDGIGKKIVAVKGIIESLGLRNCTAEQVRSEDHKMRYDVVVARAVSKLPEFIQKTKHLLVKGRGRILCLKGGDVADEVMPVRQRVMVHELKDVFDEEFFSTKKVVEVGI